MLGVVHVQVVGTTYATYRILAYGDRSKYVCEYLVLFIIKYGPLACRSLMGLRKKERTSPDALQRDNKASTYLALLIQLAVSESGSLSNGFSATLPKILCLDRKPFINLALGLLGFAHGCASRLLVPLPAIYPRWHRHMNLGARCAGYLCCKIGKISYSK